LTNRGGGISEAVMLNHIAEDNKRVILNSPKQMPIGAILDQPATPALPEFTLSRDPDGSIRCERAMPEGVTMRKKFFFPQAKEKKDNFLVELDLDVANARAQPYASDDYFLALGSAAPIHPRDYPYYTRLVWCISGKAKDRNVSAFQGSGGFLGFGQHSAQPVFQENFEKQQPSGGPQAGAEWAAVTDQFFATII